MTKKFAFTLAEVLIALAIIGVVAAMTIPTFMANTAGQQFKTGLKKSIAVLTQAAAANYATDGYDYGTAYGTAATATVSATDGAITLPAADYIIGFDTETDPAATTDMGNAPSLFHLFQNNLNMKNSKEVVNYAIAGTPIDLSCAGREASVSVGLTDGTSLTFTSTSGALNKRVKSGVTGVAADMTKGGIASLCEPVALGADGKSGGINQGRMFAMEDGSVFTYDPSQGYCSEGNPCYGYLDVNGAAGPNRVVGCTAGKDGWIPSYGREATEATLLANCTVETKDITDIYPVVFYNSSIKPASLAAKAVLYNTKSNQAASE